MTQVEASLWALCRGPVPVRRDRPAGTVGWGKAVNVARSAP